MSTTTIKTAYTDVHNLLTENAGKKLTPKLMTALEALMTSKVRSKTFELNEDGSVKRVFCYYHKEWEDVSEIPYGKKASTSHGLNTMCKQGTSNWTKQQRIMKQSKAHLLDSVANGETDPSELPTKLAIIEETAKTIVPYSAE